MKYLEEFYKKKELIQMNENKTNINWLRAI